MSEIVRERELLGWGKKGFAIAAVLFGLFHLYYSTIGLTTTIILRSGHLIFAMILGFLFYPCTRNSPHNKASVFDMIFISAAAASGIYIILIYPTMVWRLGITTKLDIVFAMLGLLTILELTRRMIGFALPLSALVLIIYAFIGPYLPSVIMHKGYDFPRVMSQLYLTLEGVYGVALGIMVSYVYLFILFGIIFLKTGGGKLFIDLSFALTGHLRGGPAKTAVIASALFASISGSPSANIVTTGTFTIPMMKKVGFKPEVAAAIETVASCGGIIMPPVMGAGAFIMAEWTGYTYNHIIAVAAIPAILYFVNVYAFVHIESKKHGIGKMKREELPQIAQVLKRNGHFVIPMIILVYILVIGYSPVMAAIAGIVSLIGISLIKKETRLGLRGWIHIFGLSAQSCIVASLACACAGIIIGIVGLTGLGLTFSSWFVEAAYGNVFLGIAMVGFASLVLGMGLPVTPAYITLAILAVPGLMNLGVDMLAAHLIIFWFSQDSNFTPPVCIAAYQAAALAKAHPIKTGIQTLRIAKGYYLIPFLMAYSQILLNGTIWQITRSTISAALAIIVLAAIFERYLIIKTRYWELVLLSLAFLSFLPTNIILNIVGVCSLCLVIISQKRRAEDDFASGKVMAAKAASDDKVVKITKAQDIY